MLLPMLLGFNIESVALTLSGRRCHLVPRVFPIEHLFATPDIEVLRMLVHLITTNEIILYIAYISSYTPERYQLPTPKSAA